MTQEDIEEENAIIESAVITTEDHGLLTAWLSLKYQGSGQGFGGYALYLPDDWKHHKGQKNYAGLFIWRVMEIAGVSRWDQLVGKTIRVRRTFSKVHEIGHIVEDKWFKPSREFEAMKDAKD